MERYAYVLSFIEGAFIHCLEIGETDKYDRVCGTGSFLAAYNLGVFYKVTGQMERVIHFYEQSAHEGYEKASKRDERY
ncbi:hypothetical protein [Anoxybacillus flavithermus]|uniref:Cell wall biosynthesis glycosyltransferase n=1 Tax=Anoxybacillus flavithermus AK1 TaxID=1297581 RepID=M8D4V4_9BACL|nr:hypothetical protein [Anoxybacillus flavithermus]EMT45872.1 cell wall biosynthesis glycosyltransferase [Anoxybacillus flavithermus AK1]